MHVYVMQLRVVFTRDIAETPSKAYTTFDTRPSPLRDMTWIAMALNDPSEMQVRHSNKEARPASKKPRKLNKIRVETPHLNKSLNQLKKPKR